MVGARPGGRYLDVPRVSDAQFHRPMCTERNAHHMSHVHVHVSRYERESGAETTVLANTIVYLSSIRHYMSGCSQEP